MEYPIPKQAVIFEEEIKKSRFITYLRHTNGITEAKAFWAEIKALRPQDGQQYGFSDDGEPAGTAGKPMLNSLIGSGLGEVSVVVVRYYGGILLGTGGLVKAYGNGVQQALAQVEKVRKVLRKTYRLQCEYEQFNTLQHLFAEQDVALLDQQFGEKIDLLLGINPVHYDMVEQVLISRFGGLFKLIEGDLKVVGDTGLEPVTPSL